MIIRLMTAFLLAFIPLIGLGAYMCHLKRYAVSIVICFAAFIIAVVYLLAITIVILLCPNLGIITT